MREGKFRLFRRGRREEKRREEKRREEKRRGERLAFKIHILGRERRSKEG